MSIQRKIEQFRPLVESGYAYSRHVEWRDINEHGDRKCVSVEKDMHVTLRINVAALAAYLVKRAEGSSRGRSGLCNGAVTLKINTTKERD
jgi:hypothetical protein